MTPEQLRPLLKRMVDNPAPDCHGNPGIINTAKWAESYDLPESFVAAILSDVQDEQRIRQRDESEGD